jgi:hypothetical protein
MDGNLKWFTSSYSPNGQSCVECAWTPDGGMAVRDSKDRNSPILKFAAGEWQAFVAGVREGEFNEQLSAQRPPGT